MIVRFGYVAMSTEVKNASPSKTMTATVFGQIRDREAAVRKLERIGAENLHNTLRLLRHNRAYDIKLYRLSSKLIPLLGHDMLEGWDPIPALRDDFKEVGDYVKLHGMRTSFHPDHFTVLSTPRKDVLLKSYADLQRHCAMLEAMGLGEDAKCNIHVGGTYGDKPKARKRFQAHFANLDETVQRRLTLENDDKTFTARETLEICEQVGVPMVLDIHHHQVNREEEDNIRDLWPHIYQTWKGQRAVSLPGEPVLPPKIHVSSPKTEKDIRSHADYVEAGPLLDFFRTIADFTPELDVMIEAKMKDGALFRLMKDLEGTEGVEILSEASVKIKA
ncbi:UV DNA damage repair endonuclease UvsE [Paenibacillus lutrae]|uniref:UV DNA damage repair endonuclease UvsE n=1 Tax=Paenibacillus lutrae TaxID=2078573 RepID=A0A7X3FI38_9BACL|nr:UV DNA damage repair endonuclease UvsE [Paenibacillus lutrae]MVO99761.1 UV DNA damage repair endonuclease UvsE [Paenibacillus lutrae]